MHITEKTKEYECCCSCKHNKRKKDGENIYCECEIDKHYIEYIECFDSVCERWKKNNMDYETLRGSMTVQDAARVLKETNCYGTMDIAKNVILKALEEQPKTDTLDKIRAEIKTMSGDIETIADVLAIIDKYKKESEE